MISDASPRTITGWLDAWPTATEVARMLATEAEANSEPAVYLEESWGQWRSIPVEVPQLRAECARALTSRSMRVRIGEAPLFALAAKDAGLDGGLVSIEVTLPAQGDEGRLLDNLAQLGVQFGAFRQGNAWSGAFRRATLAHLGPFQTSGTPDLPKPCFNIHGSLVCHDEKRPEASRRATMSSPSIPISVPARRRPCPSMACSTTD